MTLVLEIEYLSGVSFAAIGPDSEAPDWPPQPDRIFSALVASWAARGQREEERKALEWLEMRPVPYLLASEAEPRTTLTAYVPPNDFETPKGELGKLRWYRDFLSKGISPPEKGGSKKLWMQAWNVMPDQRKHSGLKERNFPAARPHDPVVRLYWSAAEPDEAMLSALQALAHDTAYIGHSASLTRCRFLRDGGALEWGAAQRPRRGVYQGRLEELRHAYVRFEKSADKKDRPQKGARIPPEPEAKAARTNLFGAGNRWMILEHVTGDMPDVRTCALVAKTLRDTLLSGYRQIGLEDKIPEAVSGHAAGGTPAQTPHLAIIPLAFAGFPYADGHVMGFALVPPADNEILTDETFRKVLRALSPVDEDRGRRILTLMSKSGTSAGSAFSIGLSPTFEPPTDKQSLDPTLYTGSAFVFVTVTPIVLDRHLKEKGTAREKEAAAQIAAACRNIGLPEPEVVVVGKHSAVEGAPSAYPSGNSPRWMNWRLPPSLASRQLIHAVIRFAEPVDGPVILGAGRFVGLGLCRPINDRAPDADR
ncbi:MAG TPA: type I-U CRISPR-associated protein Csb2 [Gemmataceae bacterium]|nr:type I-U CRISPR-associated protein Csb2 [Gemmataceae bacterium]